MNYHKTRYVSNFDVAADMFRETCPGESAGISTGAYMHGRIL